MSFTVIEPAAPRLNRSELAVPAVRPELFAKAAASAADVVLIDLEDSVPPDDKPRARANAVAALRDIDWGGKGVSVRVNGLDTPYCYRDVIDLIEQGGERLDMIMIPKVGTAADVYAVDVLVSQVEAAVGRRRRLGFELLIETALGLGNLESIAAASRRTESLSLGVADLAASLQARSPGIGIPSPGYAVLTEPGADGRRQRHWGDMWHYALARLVTAARANGLRPLDGPFGGITDAEGFLAQAERAAALGCEGKWAIHPSQVEPANRVFSPTADEVDRARRVLAAMAEAQAAGRAAVTLDGRMIDIASIRQAEAVVAKADRIAGHG